MNKKTYKQPQLKVVQLDNSDIICASPDPRGLSINEDVGDYEEEERPDVSRDIWGNQW